MTNAEKALQYFIIAVPDNKEQAEARAKKAEKCIAEIQSARDHTRPSYVVDQILKGWKYRSEIE